MSRDEHADGDGHRTDAPAWPPGLTPAWWRIYTFHELTVSSPPEEVWTKLVRADRWPEWFDNCRDMRIEGGGDRLAEGTVFRWITFGVRVRCAVDRWEPGRLLAWTGTGLGSRGHHRWFLHPADGGGTHVISEEVMTGLGPVVGRLWLRRALLRSNGRWLGGLATPPLP
jgi:hypothetical protein